MTSISSDFPAGHQHRHFLVFIGRLVITTVVLLASWNVAGLACEFVNKMRKGSTRAREGDL